MSQARDDEQEATREALARAIRVVRVGHGANCSSVGSVIDTLFASAVVGGAIFAAVAAALAREEVRVVASRPPADDDARDGERDAREDGRS